MHVKVNIKFLSLLVILILFISIISQSCNPVVDFNKISEIDQKARDELEYNISNTDIDPDSVNIVIDITGSMQGFSNAGNSLENFLMDIDASFQPKKVNYFSFSKKLEKLDNYLPFLRPKLYTAEKTQYQLLEDFIKVKGISILITDLQFNNDDDRLYLTNILRNFISNSTFVKILGAKINFNGKYYPRGGNPNLKHEGERPVYAIIFSQDNYKKFIERALRNSRIWTNSLSLFNELPFKITIDTKDSNYFSDYVNGTDNSVIIYDYKSSNLNIKLITKNEIFSEWNDVTDRDIILDFFKVNNSNNNISFETLYNIGYVETVSRSTKEQIVIKLILDKISIKEHYLIVVKINPQNVPQWINDWSVETREIPTEQATHTLFFDRIIKDIISSVAEPYILGFSFLHLKN